MKKITLLLFTLITIGSFAQTDALIKPKKSRLYFDAGIGYTCLGKLSHLSLSYITKNNWGLVLGNETASRLAREKPADYYDDNILYSTTNAYDFVKFYSLRKIKFYSLKNSRKKLCVEYGVSLAKNYRAHFTPKPTGGFFVGGGLSIFGSNYKIDYENEYSLGLSFRASLYKPTRRSVGFQLSGVANINPYTPFVGVELNLRLGK